MEASRPIVHPTAKDMELPQIEQVRALARGSPDEAFGREEGLVSWCHGVTAMRNEMSS